MELGKIYIGRDERYCLAIRELVLMAYHKETAMIRPINPTCKYIRHNFPDTGVCFTIFTSLNFLFSLFILICPGTYILSIFVNNIFFVSSPSVK